MFSGNATFPAVRRSRLAAALLTLGLLAAIVTNPSTALPQSAGGTLQLNGLGRPKLEVDGTWRYKATDAQQFASPGMASPGYDDSHWQQVHPSPLIEQNLPPAQFNWFRRHLEIQRENPTQQLAVNINAFDSYAVYWNGQLLGGLSEVPPHFNWPYFPFKTFLLPLPADKVLSGVLAVRVWCQYPAVDNANCGFNEPPSIGDAKLLEQIPQQTLREYALSNLPEIANSLFSLLNATVLLIMFLRGGKDPLYLWFTLLLLGVSLTSSEFLNLPDNWYQLIIDVSNGCLDAGFILLLTWLLGMERIRWLRRAAVSVACVVFVSDLIDGIVSLCWAHAGEGFRRVDAITSSLTQTLQPFPLVLLGIAIFRKRRNANWPVICTATLFSLASQRVNMSYQWHAPFQGRFDWVHYEFHLGPLIFLPTTILFELLVLTLAITVVRRFLAERHRQEQVERELLSAREVQQLLVPEDIPAIPGYAVASVYRPAAEVGGDFFQIIPWENGGALIAIGDVSGKGMKAAMIVSLIIGSLRTLVSYTREPAEILKQLNVRLHGRISGGFVTCLVLRIGAGGQLTAANAGHIAPYLHGKEMEQVSGSLPLGIEPELIYDQVTLRLSEGDTMTMLTDGVLEARNAAKELYSFDRLSQLLANDPSAEQIVEAACAFGQQDDITVLTLTRLAFTAPAHAATVSLTTQLA